MAGTWMRLAHVALSSAGDTIDSGTFTAKKNLKVIIFVINSGAVRTGIRFNSDSGNNYAHRRQVNGGSDATNVNHNRIVADTDVDGSDYTVANIINKSDKEKLIRIERIHQSGSGASNTPEREEMVGKWVNTSDSITSIQAYNAESGDFGVGSYITVFGASGDTVTDTTDDGSIFEASDTGKHYIWNATSDSWTKIM